MKKSVIIIIGIIYIASIVAINFFGMKISVYNQKVNVQEIVCLNETNLEKGINVKDYTDMEGNVLGKSIIIDYVKPANKNTLQGTILQLEVRVFPDNATNKKLIYTSSDNENIEFYTDESGNQTGMILFYGPTRFFYVTIRSTDYSNVELTLQIRAKNVQ